MATLVLVRITREDRLTIRGEARAFLAGLAMFSLFYGTFFLRSLLSGNYIAPSDSFDFGVADYLSSPALWSDGIWSGYPVAADPQALTWYPPLRLFRALGIDWNLFLISAYVIASSTSFLLVRRVTRSALAGAFSGIVCGFNALAIGYLTNFNQIHAFAWVPLVLYGLQLIREGLHRSGAAVGAAAVALMFLAGHPQIPVYAMYLAVAVSAGTLAVDCPPLRLAVRRLQWSAIALTLGLALAAVMFVPMIELSAYSPRASSGFALYSSSALPPRELLTLIVPFAFGGFWVAPTGVPYTGITGDSAYLGVLPLALALAAPFVLRRHRGEARLWIGIGLIEAVLSLGPATPLGTIFFYAPGFSGFQAPLRHLFLFSLCAAIASGLTMAELTDVGVLRRIAATGVAVVAGVGVLGIGVIVWTMPDVYALFHSRSDYVRWAFAWPLVPAIVLLLVAITTTMSRWRVTAAALGTMLIACETADLTVVHYRLPGRRFEYADVVRTEAVLHPRMAALRAELKQTGERALASDGSKNPFLLPNLTRPWGVPAASGTGSLAINDYLDVLGMDTSGSVSRTSLADTNRGADLFGVRYALVRQNSDLAAEVQKQPTRWQIVENLHYYESDPDTFYTLFRNERALPRASCASRLMHVSTAEVLDAIRSNRIPGGGAFDPRSVALLESELPPGWDDNALAGEAHAALDRTSRDERFVVNAERACMLVISEVYYPWWRAALDESPVEVHRVNHAMLGVVVPPGSHLVRLWMLPLSLWLGAAISGAALLVWGVLVVWRTNGLR